MALDIEVDDLDDRILNNIQITHNNLFICPADEDISVGDLLQLVDYHRLNIRNEYLKERQYYEGDHAINHQLPKPHYKPDNRLVINFPRKAVTSFNGFFIGTPVKIDSPDDNVDQYISKWENINSFEDVSAEVSKQSSIYGKAFFYVYQDEQGNPCVVDCDPLNTFLIYDDSIANRVKYGVQYHKNILGQTSVTLISTTWKREFVVDGSTNQFMNQVRVTANPYPLVPIVEVRENEERLSLCHDIVSLIDELDKAMSEKANDVDYFADAYMKIINAHIKPEDAEKLGAILRDQRLVTVDGDEDGNVTPEVDFMTKPNADTTQENLVDRLVDYIYQIANVTNMNDEAFAGNPSGVTLKLKYQPMKDMAEVKTHKFRRALRDVFECVFSVSDLDNDAWQDLEFRFTQSVPNNLVELSQAFNNFYGKMSNKTLFKQMPFIDDPDKEIAQMKEEQKENQQATASALQKYLTDQQKGGVGNGNNSATGTSKNATVDKSGQPDGSTD